MTVYKYESKGVRASGTLNGKSFTVLKGSGAVGDDERAKSFDPCRQELRQKLISNGTLIKNLNCYRFQKDYTFNSSSQAASIISANNVSGPKVFGINKALTPSSVILSTHAERTVEEELLPSSVLTFPIDNEHAVEGYKKDQQLYMSERNAELAKLRKQKDDYTCQACGFKLEVSGNFVIECHHIDPISWGLRETILNDLVSLCPTCHRIAHTRKPIYKVAEIASIRQG